MKQGVTPAQRIRLLESELAAAGAALQSHIEQFRGLNEELSTVNSRLQKKILEQERLNNDLTNFLASTSIPTVFLDHQFRVKRFTPAMSKLLELIPSDAGRPIADIARENLGPDLLSDAAAVLDTLAPVRREVNIGEMWYVRAVLPYRTSDSRIEGVVVTYNDITGLKQAEECNARLASFPQLNPNPVIEVDPSGRVTYANAASYNALESMGLDRDNVMPLLPQDLGAIVAEWDRKTEAALYREIEVKDRVFGATIQLAPQFNVVRVYAFEITKRRRAEEALRRAKEEWELTFDSVPDLVAIIDNEHRIRRVNRAMARRLGLTPEQCVGLRCFEHVHGTCAPPLFCPHSRTILDGREHDAEVREERLGGDFIVTTTPLVDARGGRIGTVHVAHDITARKKAEEALRQRTDALEGANRELESFIYSVSHDLRAPLRHISGFVGILMEDYDGQLDAQGKDYLTRIRKGSERMARLIDDLLYLSRISRQEMSTESVDLSAISLSVVNDLREANPGRQVEVHIGEGLCSPADPRLITLALRNLLENAWKFTSHNGNARIEFNAAEKEGETVYYVKDNGAGFDQEFAGRMFWPFQRLHTEQEFEGTGIGLAIVERVIRRHGGKVWAEGQPGKGAVIYFTL